MDVPNLMVVLWCHKHLSITTGNTYFFIQTQFNPIQALSFETPQKFFQLLRLTFYKALQAHIFKATWKLSETYVLATTINWKDKSLRLYCLILCCRSFYSAPNQAFSKLSNGSEDRSHKRCQLCLETDLCLKKQQGLYLS